MQSNHLRHTLAEGLAELNEPGSPNAEDVSQYVLRSATLLNLFDRYHHEQIGTICGKQNSLTQGTLEDLEKSSAVVEVELRDIVIQFEKCNSFGKAYVLQRRIDNAIRAFSTSRYRARCARDEAQRVMDELLAAGDNETELEKQQRKTEETHEDWMETHSHPDDYRAI